MPVYNAAKYLKRSIESVLNQSYRDFELIIVNDGSTDDSERVCKKYAELDPRVRYFYKKNEGASVARNFGMERASGMWISFVDSDDELCPAYLLNMVEKTDGSDLVMQGMMIVNNGEQKSAGINKDLMFINNDCIEALYENFNVFGICGPCCKLFKTSIIKENNILFSKRITCAEDYGFLLDYLLFCKSIVTIKKHDYLYFSNQNSLSSRLHSFEKEFSSLIELNKKYNILLDKIGSKSLIRQRNSFIGYYTYRVVYSIYLQNDLKRKVRLNNLRLIPHDLIKCWYTSYESKSAYINFAKWLISNKQYWLFDVITKLVYRQ